jgi:hypothetical protein
MRCACYGQAIHSARANGFVDNEAIASELVARCRAARGLETNSLAHLRNTQVDEPTKLFVFTSPDPPQAGLWCRCDGPDRI